MHNRPFLHDVCQRWGSYGAALLSAAMGIVYAIVFGIAGDWTGAAIGFTIMAAFAGVLMVSQRYGVLRRLHGAGDERERWLDAEAIQFSYLVAVVVFTTLGLIDVVHGKTGSSWFLVDAVLGGSYLLALVYQTWRDR